MIIELCLDFRPSADSQQSCKPVTARKEWNITLSECPFWAEWSKNGQLLGAPSWPHTGDLYTLPLENSKYCVHFVARTHISPGRVSIRSQDARIVCKEHRRVTHLSSEELARILSDDTWKLS